MYCSGCGQILAAGQPFCPQCGRPASAPVTPIPGYELQLHNYAGQVRALGIVWFVYAGLTVLLGVMGLAFANAFLSGHMHEWFNGPNFNGAPFGPWLPMAILRFAWVFLLVRAGLAVAAGWGLYYRTSWGRVVAIVAAIFSLLKFPLGTALGIWTLVTMLGYRNTSLYEQLPQA